MSSLYLFTPLITLSRLQLYIHCIYRLVTRKLFASPDLSYAHVAAHKMASLTLDGNIK